MSVREGKSGKGWFESSNVEFTAKFVANSLALSEAGENKLGSVNDCRNRRFPAIKYTVGYSPKFPRPKAFLGNPSLDRFGITIFSTI